MIDTLSHDPEVLQQQLIELMERYGKLYEKVYRLERELHRAGRTMDLIHVRAALAECERCEPFFSDLVCLTADAPLVKGMRFPS